MEVERSDQGILSLLKKSGPGWIQAAVTLGGGTLVSALYLGVIGGYKFLWIQPFAMLLGVIMLGALSYVNLSTDTRPFRLAQKHISPALAWSWLIGAMIANIVFCASQFALASDALSGNLNITLSSPYMFTIPLALLGLTVVWLFIKEGKTGKLIDSFIKVLVALIILSFMIVVVVLGINGAIPWGAFFNGWIPKPAMLFEPNAAYTELIDSSGALKQFWSDYIIKEQRNIIIGAFGTAVGINMTFLLPYSQRKKGWSRGERKLSIFDLIMGLLLPFIIAASCLIIATASQFHARDSSIVNELAYNNILDQSLIATQDVSYLNPEKLEELRHDAPKSSKKLSTMLARRSTNDLAEALKPFLGKYAQLLFGIGILAMAFSTMIIHMMINGYAISEAFGNPGEKRLFMIGASIPALSGMFSPIVWAGSVKAAVIVPASVIATTLLPIAYLLIVLLIFSRKALPKDAVRSIPIKALLLTAVAIATFASMWALIGFYNSDQTYQHVMGLVGLALLTILAVIGLSNFIRNERRS